MVLGEKLWEEKGKAIGFSIKSIGPEGVHVEETFTSIAQGFGRGPSGTNVGTLNVVEAPDGSSSGTGHGIFRSQDGDVVTWRAYFAGRMEMGIDKSFGVVKFMTASPKLAWMNNIIAALEGTSDPKTLEMANTGYEWK